MIEVPAQITKTQLSAGRRLYGAVNDSPVTIGETTYPARTLRYVAFAGTPVKNSRPAVFDGVNRFEALSKADDTARPADFETIPATPEE